MEKYQKRIIEEHKNLNKKIVKLTAFIISSKMRGIKIQELQELKDQLNVMDQYSKILETRINNFLQKAPAILVKDGVMTTMSKDEEIQKLGQLLTVTKIEDKVRLLSIVRRLIEIMEEVKELRLLKDIVISAGIKIPILNRIWKRISTHYPTIVELTDGSFAEFTCYIRECSKEDTPPQGGSGVPSLFHDFFDGQDTPC